MLVAKKIGSAVLTFTKEYTILNYSYSMFTTGWKRVPFKNLRRFGSDVSQLQQTFIYLSFIIWTTWHVIHICLCVQIELIAIHDICIYYIDNNNVVYLDLLRGLCIYYRQAKYLYIALMVLQAFFLITILVFNFLTEFSWLIFV